MTHTADAVSRWSEFVGTNNETLRSLRAVTEADENSDGLCGMGLSAAQWKEVLAQESVRPYLRINVTSMELYFVGYIAAQFSGEECVHLSVAIGDEKSVTIREGGAKSDRPSAYNATREAGIAIVDALCDSIQAKTGVDVGEMTCLSRFIPGIPHGDARNDKGLHMSLFNKAPSDVGPSAAEVEAVRSCFPGGLAIQLELSNLSIVQGSRCNDLRTGGLYYLACGMSKGLSTLCGLIKERFSSVIKGYAPHLSLELWGVSGCAHPQHVPAEDFPTVEQDLKFWHCDYIRWGMASDTFAKCLDDEKRFDIARYMHARTQRMCGAMTEDDRSLVRDTLAQLNDFRPDSVEDFVAMVDAFTSFGSIPKDQRFHDSNSEVTNFFANAPLHDGIDGVAARIRNCGAAAGKGPRWFPKKGILLPGPYAQSTIKDYIKGDGDSQKSGSGCALGGGVSRARR